MSNPALWGLIRAGVWPWSTAVACVVHWRARTGSAGLGTGSSTARAARRPRSSPERGACAPKARQGLRDLAERDQGGPGGAHRALDRRRWPGEDDGVADRRRSGGRACGGGFAAVPRVSGSDGSTREAPAGILEGLGGCEVTGGEEIVEAGRLTRGGAPGKSRPLQVMGSCGEASGSFLASRQGRCGAWADRGSTEQRRCGGARSSVPAEQGGCGVAAAAAD